MELIIKDNIIYDLIDILEHKPNSAAVCYTSNVNRFFNAKSTKQMFENISGQKLR